MPVPCSTKHLDNFKANIADVIRLIQIHRDVTGTERGRRIGVQCLNKSAIVLILASWEAFVEDLAESAFDCMLINAPSHATFPSHVLTLAWADFKNTPPTDAFSTITNGWKSVLSKHRQKILEKHIVRGAFNTPSATNCDALYSSLIGLTSFTSCWAWKKFSATQSTKKLAALIDLRGEIAHRAKAADAVQKQVVLSYAKFVTRLAVRSHNSVRTFLNGALAFDTCVEFSTDEETALLEAIELVNQQTATQSPTPSAGQTTQANAASSTRSQSRTSRTPPAVAAGPAPAATSAGAGPTSP